MRHWVSYNIQDLYNETLGILQYTGSVQWDSGYAIVCLFQLSLTTEWPEDDDFLPSTPPSGTHFTPCSSQQWLEHHGISSETTISRVTGWFTLQNGFITWLLHSFFVLTRRSSARPLPVPSPQCVPSARGVCRHHWEEGPLAGVRGHAFVWVVWWQPQVPSCRCATDGRVPGLSVWRDWPISIQ